MGWISQLWEPKCSQFQKPWNGQHWTRNSWRKGKLLSSRIPGLEALQSYTTSKYAEQENRIYREAELITEGGFTLTLQWVPSHNDIAGNKVADRTTNEAHNLIQTILCPLSIEDGKRKVKRAASRAWQLYCNTQKDNFHIGIIKPNISHWP